MFNITKKLVLCSHILMHDSHLFFQLDGDPKPNDRTVTRICTIDSTLVQYMHLLLISSLHIRTCIYIILYIYIYMYIYIYIYIWFCSYITKYTGVVRKYCGHLVGHIASAFWSPWTCGQTFMLWVAWMTSPKHMRRYWELLFLFINNYN